MADIKFNCQHCNQPLEAPPEYFGQSIDCPACGGQITVPEPSLPKAPVIPPRPKVVLKTNSQATQTNQNTNTPVYRMDGLGSNLVVYPDKLEIVTAGLSGFVLKGLKGTKTIPFLSISGIQFKEAGTWSGAGYLQFTIPGGNESRQGLFDATMDENTFMFRSDNERATKIKNYIETRIRELRTPQPQQTQSAPSFSAELEKIAALHKQGILSDDEFQQAKSRLLK